MGAACGADGQVTFQYSSCPPYVVVALQTDLTSLTLSDEQLACPSTRHLFTFMGNPTAGEPNRALFWSMGEKAPYRRVPRVSHFARLLRPPVASACGTTTEGAEEAGRHVVYFPLEEYPIYLSLGGSK